MITRQASGTRLLSRAGLNLDYRVNKLSFLILLLISPLVLIAQSEEEFLSMKQKHPEQAAIFLYDIDEITIDFEGDSVVVFQNHSERMLHLNEQSKGFSNKKIYYSFFSEILDIEAQTLVPGKRRYSKTKVETFTESHEQHSGIFFDDSKSKSFLFPSIQTGAYTELNYTKKIKEPRLLNSYYFGSVTPVEESILKLRVHKSIKIAFKTFHTDDLDLKFNKAEDGDFIIYSWELEDAPEFEFEGASPSISYYHPHIVYYIEEYTLDGDTQKVLSSLDDLYDWYYEFSKGVQEASGNEYLSGIVDSILQGDLTEIEKVKKIYYWVQENISYVAIADKYNGFIPSDPTVVCKKKYGDCKGMSSLIYKLLKEAGIKSYLTWIGTRKIPYKYTELHTPIVDNHMIITYIHKGTYYYLDATSKYSYFGLPSYAIQGKEAFISKGKEGYEIKVVTTMPASESTILDSMNIELVDGKVKLKGVMKFEGYLKLMNSYSLIGLSEKDTKDKVLGILSKGNNKFFVDDYSIKNLEDKDQPLVISYAAYINDYYSQVGDEIYYNTNLDKIYNNDVIDTSKRKTPIKEEYSYEYKLKYHLKIPKKYTVQYLPKDESYTYEKFGFSIDYQKTENHVNQELTYTSSHLMLELADMGKWNEMIEKMTNAYREVLIIKKQSQ